MWRRTSDRLTGTVELPFHLAAAGGQFIHEISGGYYEWEIDHLLGIGFYPCNRRRSYA